MWVHDHGNQHEMQKSKNYHDGNKSIKEIYNKTFFWIFFFCSYYQNITKTLTKHAMGKLELSAKNLKINYMRSWYLNNWWLPDGLSTLRARMVVLDHILPPLNLNHVIQILQKIDACWQIFTKLNDDECKYILQTTWIGMHWWIHVCCEE